MKKIIASLVFLLASFALYAEHITGGEMYYILNGVNNGLYSYSVTLKLFRSCGSVGAPLDPNAAIAIFNNTNRSMVWNESVRMLRSETLQLGDPGPCITNAPSVCYEVGYYVFDVNLPATFGGYSISFQRFCRINGINNVVASGSYGATYTAIIPGTSVLADRPEKNSAKFIQKDTIIVF